MKTMKMKKRNLVTMILLFCGLCVMVHAQENSWAKQRSQYLKKQLELTDEQTAQIYEVLTDGARERQEIKENITGDELKRANWRVTKKQNERIASTLTPEQNVKLKELREQEKTNIQENNQQKIASSNKVTSQWAKRRSQHYKKELGLTDEQTDKVYEELAAHEKRAKAIRENTAGDEQKKALWRNTKEQHDRLFEILTPQQVKDLKELWKKENNK